MSFLDWLGRVGAGLGAAGRDVTGQMFGRLGPNDPSTFSGRMGNIAANNANPMALMQTGQAFMEGFRGTPGPARDLTGAAGRVSDAVAQRVTGSVVGRGFIGQSPGPAVPGRTVEPRNALGYRLGQVPGGPTGGGNWSVATAGRGTGAIPISREGGPIMTAPTQAEIDAMAAEQGGFPISPSANRPTPMRDGRGGYNGRSWASARGVGQGMRRTNEQALQEVMEQMERWRNRGGLLQER